MQKIKKSTIGVVIAVLVVGGVALASQSELLQGRLGRSIFGRSISGDYSNLYLYNTEVVSAVASPVTSAVPSVVTSNVTSRGGTSKVASVVVSPVTSPVVSAVPVDRRTASKVNIKTLKDLTSATLNYIQTQEAKKNSVKYRNEGKKDFIQNPGKFTLTEKQKQNIIDAFTKANK